MASGQQKKLINHKEFREVLIEDSGYRVYFSNTGADRKQHPVRKKQKHIVDWVGYFVPSNYKQEQCKTWIPMHSWSIERLVQWARKSDKFELIDGLVDEAIKNLAGQIPDSTSLQNAYEGRLLGVITPQQVARRIQEIVDKWLPENKFESIKTILARYKNKSMDSPVTVEIPLRAVGTLVCVAFACEEANRGDVWYRKVHNMKGKPKIAGCRMAQGVYLYRRYTDASIEQIATVLRVPVWE